VIEERRIGLRRKALLQGAGQARAPMISATPKGGTPLGVRGVNRMIKRAGDNPAISSHWLRHAHTSHALDRGASLAEVKGTLGHAPPWRSRLVSLVWTAARRPSPPRLRLRPGMARRPCCAPSPRACRGLPSATCSSPRHEL
jgi:integrase